MRRLFIRSFAGTTPRSFFFSFLSLWVVTARGGSCAPRFFERALRGDDVVCAAEAVWELISGSVREIRTGRDSDSGVS